MLHRGAYAYVVAAWKKRTHTVLLCRCASSYIILSYGSLPKELSSIYVSGYKTR